MNLKSSLFGILLFAGILNAAGQKNDCNLRTVTDKIANSKTVYTPVVSVTVGKQTVNLNFYRSGRAIVFSALVSGDNLFCVDYTSSFLFHFSDKSSFPLHASNAGNCTGSMQSTINEQMTDADMQTLASKTIVSVYLIGKDQQLDVVLNAGDAHRIKTYFGCIRLAQP